jgi:hypothetical protein
LGHMKTVLALTLSLMTMNAFAGKLVNMFFEDVTIELTSEDSKKSRFLTLRPCVGLPRAEDFCPHNYEFSEEIFINFRVNKKDKKSLKRYRISPQEVITFEQVHNGVDVFSHWLPN